jgi:NADPH:quinone reductase-like Zn-dependent oxidoreductase
MILGTDAAGVDPDGNDVVVHAVISHPDWRADETLDPNRSLLSERHQGTMAERVMVPRRNLVPKPPTLSFEEAACLPTAWLTAYRMLFTQAGVRPGSTVLVQGAGGGVATALVTLGAAAGARMWVTSRDPDKAARAVELGADEVFRTGERLPERVDAVMETVGAATWQHSLRAVRPGGTVVLSGATSGRTADTELSRIYFLQLRVLGSTMGTRQELEHLLRFCSRTGVRPIVDRVLPMKQARQGIAALERGEVFGKVVLTP